MVKIRNNLKEEEISKRKTDRNLLIAAFVLFSLMLVLIILNTFVYINIQVQQTSMQPTLYDGDILVANKRKAPGYGDVIIISGVEEYWLIKRVIGLGGDKIEIKEGFVWRNGEKLTEAYVKVLTDSKGMEEITLEKDEVFYLGDNRRDSKDSRVLGPCKIENVVGVVENWSIRTKGARTFIFKTLESAGEFFGMKNCTGTSK